jgi:type IV pilus assembly protein PilW
MTLSMRVRPASSQRGLSLIEMMISISIGLFLLAGLVGIFVNSSQTSAELSRQAQQVENGRFAMQTLVDDLTLAGYYGHYAPPAATAAPDPCTITVAALTAALPMPVQAYNAPLSPPAPVSGCLTDANHVQDTDILVVRRADTQETTGTNFEIGRIYIQASPDPSSTPVIAAATATNGPVALFPLKNKDNSIAPRRKLHVHIYFISPCSQPLVCTGAVTDDSIPTLKRIELTSAGLQIVPIAEGIENLQFDYGLDADGDGAPETPFVADPATPANWTNVVALQVALLARNVESSPGYADTKTYNLGQFATSFTPSGAAASFKRHAYTGLVRVVNTSARREQP